jgi:hypothetical protein
MLYIDRTVCNSCTFSSLGNLDNNSTVITAPGDELLNNKLKSVYINEFSETLLNLLGYSLTKLPKHINCCCVLLQVSRSRPILRQEKVSVSTKRLQSVKSFYYYYYYLPVYSRAGK